MRRTRFARSYLPTISTSFHDNKSSSLKHVDCQQNEFNSHIWYDYLPIR